jgi:hypothetical protein
MSMSALSTEIDEHVIQYLSHADLHNLSLVSKYYRALAEPHMYRHFVFRGNHAHTMFLLFFAILARKDLALHIKSFTLEEGAAGAEKFGNERVPDDGDDWISGNSEYPDNLSAAEGLRQISPLVDTDLCARLRNSSSI